MFETIFNITTRHIFAVKTGKGRVIDLNRHTHGRLVNQKWRQRLRGVWSADGCGNFKISDAADTNNITGRSFLNITPFKP